MAKNDKAGKMGEAEVVILVPCPNYGKALMPGGRSDDVRNVQILCARHNLQKGAKIQ